MSVMNTIRRRLCIRLLCDADACAKDVDVSDLRENIFCIGDFVEEENHVQEIAHP